MKKNYNYSGSSLNNKYQLVTERYFMEITEEMIKPECWNRDLNHPIPECFNEDGTLKQECYKTVVQTPANPVPENSEGPDSIGSETSFNMYDQDGGGETMVGENKHKEHCMIILNHLNALEECTGNWMAECSHPGAPMALEAVQRLKEYINECSY